MNQQPASATTTSPSNDNTNSPSSPTDTNTDKNESNSPTTTQPSRVVHFRHVTAEITQNDLVSLCATCGKVTHVLLLKNNQALVQFADLNEAVEFVQRFGGDQKSPNRQAAIVRGVTLYPNYSSHKELSKGSLDEVKPSNNSNTTRNGILETPSDQEKQNRIILVTIYNVYQFSINADTIYQVCHPFGQIEKIVMFNKNSGHQALVQYQRVQDALNARQALHGQSLYNNNVCSLSVQFSNLTDLTVHQNSDRARDYTKGGGSLFTQGILEAPVVPNQQLLVNQQLVPQLLAQTMNVLPQAREPEKSVLLVSNFNDKV
jgi:hypothetical protein